ncbi:hypothetical protein LCGC14_1515560 [marine sediment metagenome]|uniref:Uncharacterized protein n=1 Tax=marine sediment metagenome TaxID=412755 RepID=A0A0F9JKW6_9ZZZZ
MLFHDSVFNGHHMMHWDMGHFIPLIFGWGAILLVISVLLYFAIQTARNSKSKDQVNIPMPKSKENDLVAYDITQNEEANEKSNFCYSCGNKLDTNRGLEYCPNCGVKV